MLTAFFFFGLLTGLQAQDKYEFARVLFAPNLGGKLDGIYVTISGKETVKVLFEKKSLNQFLYDYTPIVDYIQKMSDEGWEVITILPNEYYLKRKKTL